LLPSAYIETSVISYLTGRRSRDEISAAHQQLTRDWWDRRRSRFEIYVSELVVQEASRGDRAAAHARLEAITGYPVLRVNADAQRLADRILTRAVLPSKAAADALHIAHRKRICHAVGEYALPRRWLRTAAGLHTSGTDGRLI
jgi:predicted nucleic acid-binding protein